MLYNSSVTSDGVYGEKKNNKNHCKTLDSTKILHSPPYNDISVSRCNNIYVQLFKTALSTQNFLILSL